MTTLGLILLIVSFSAGYGLCHWTIARFWKNEAIKAILNTEILILKVKKYEARTILANLKPPTSHAHPDSGNDPGSTASV